MIITLLNDTFTWYGIHWDVHTIAESTNDSKRVSKMQFKHSIVMSRPLRLCTSEKLHDYAVVRWTYSRPPCDKHMTNCCVRKGPWTGVHWSSWCRSHYGCRFDWFECLLSCIWDVCVTALVCSLREGVVPSKGPRSTTFSRGQCCKRGERSLATWRESVVWIWKKKQGGSIVHGICM